MTMQGREAAPRPRARYTPGGSQPHAESVAPTEHVLALDGIRGAAIALVMVYHVALFGSLVLGHAATAPRVEGWLFAVVRHGWLGVDLFFALSGFLITGILYDAKGRGRYFRTFFARRSLRIFPLYYLALAGLFLVSLRLQQPAAARTGAAWAWAYVVNVRGALFGLSTVSEHLQHFWSLAVEEQFYLVWPFLVLAASRRGMMRICVVGFVLSILLRLVLKPVLPGPAEWLMPARLDALAAGAWVALALRGPLDAQRARRVALWTMRGAALCLALSLTGVTLRLSRGPLDFRSLSISIGAVLFASTIATVVLSRGGRTARVFSAAPLRFLGRYSYALYVVHQPLTLALVGLPLFHRVLGASESRLPLYALLLAAVITLSIAGALVSWHVWEKHFLRLKDRFTYAPVPAAPPSAKAA